MLQTPLPPPGCIVPAPGFPTLYALPVSVSDRKVELNVFGFTSKKPSLVVKLEMEGEHGAEDAPPRSILQPKA